MLVNYIHYVKQMTAFSRSWLPLKIRSSTHVSGNAPSAKSYRYRGQPGHPKTKSLADDAMKENKHLRSLGVRKNPKIEVTPTAAAGV
jgi:hypothetical protein